MKLSNFNYNLGVAVACAIKAALEKHDLSGKIVLLGTPGNAYSANWLRHLSSHYYFGSGGRWIWQGGSSRKGCL
jgi:hypothetical protein